MIMCFCYKVCYTLLFILYKVILYKSMLGQLRARGGGGGGGGGHGLKIMWSIKILQCATCIRWPSLLLLELLLYQELCFLLAVDGGFVKPCPFLEESMIHLLMLGGVALDNTLGCIMTPPSVSTSSITTVSLCTALKDLDPAKSVT